MSTQTEEKKEAPPTLEKKADREKSTLAFPYVPYDEALGIAKAIHDHGGVPVTRDQLSSIVHEKKNFDVRVAAARLFGLVEAPAGKYQLTETAYFALDKDENRQKEAKRDAFLNVPLYKKVYEDCKGKALPPRPTGLENLFSSLGVSTKQVGPARIAFDKSASQTGYFTNGNNDRLVAPIIAPSSKRLSEDDMLIAAADQQIKRADGTTSKTNRVSQQEEEKRQLHRFVEGLLDELPAPRTSWPHADRVKWLLAAAQIFDLIYKSDGQNVPKGPIKICVE